jgi:curved DNA-binding protein CbpA
VPARRDMEWPWRDHYTVLGVEPSASARQITSAYRRLVRTLHPDSHPRQPSARERFAEVVDAYATLHDPVRRAAHDAERERRTRGALEGRPIRVRVTRTPGASAGSSAATSRQDLAGVAGFDVTVGLFRPMASVRGVLLWAGPVRLYTGPGQAQGASGLGGWRSAWFRRTSEWL